MKFAYLMNAYPMTSTTFIRREIEAHERAGYSVDRFAVRPWEQPLVDPKDIAEADRVFYLLGQGVFPLFFAFLSELVTNPRGSLRALGAVFHLMRKGRGRRLKPLVYLLEAVRLKRETRARRIDHLHTHFSTNSAAVTLLSHLLGGPGYSITVHGPDELYEMTENALTLKVQHARFVAVITEYCRRTVDTHTGGRFTGKIHVVPCGLDMREFAEVTPVPETRDLVCVGRLCEAKAQVLQVEAMAEAVQDFPDARLILIGDGEARPAVEAKIAEHGLEDTVVLAGWQSNDEVRAALTSARALMLPSLAEGLPIVIMESFALGRPVLTTRITGIPELVDESCGWLVEPGDRHAIAEALAELLATDPARLTEMAAVGRSRVADRHDQDRNAAELRRWIEELAKL